MLTHPTVDKLHQLRCAWRWIVFHWIVFHGYNSFCQKALDMEEDREPLLTLFERTR